jgi:hypothetical protein
MWLIYCNFIGRVANQRSFTVQRINNPVIRAYSSISKNKLLLVHITYIQAIKPKANFQGQIIAWPSNSIVKFTVQLNRILIDLLPNPKRQEAIECTVLRENMNLHMLEDLTETIWTSVTRYRCGLRILSADMLIIIQLIDD